MWINLLVGAVLGALAVFVINLILKRTTLADGVKRTVQTVAVTATVVIGVNLISPPLQAQYAISNVEENLLKQPAYAAMKKHEPEAYQRIMDILQEGLKADKPVADIQVAARSVLSDLIEKRIPVADDAVVVDYMKVSMRELREIHAGSDDACYTFLNPTSGKPFDVTKRVSSATMEADGRALAAVIESAATAPQPRVNLAEYEVSFVKVVEKLQAKYGDDLAMLDKLQTALPAKRRVCEMTADLYDEIFAMPPDQAGKITRAMLGSGS